MPMVTVQLTCGCRSVVHYRAKVPWNKVPESDRKELLSAITELHKCPAKPAKAPPTSPEPQKP